MRAVVEVLKRKQTINHKRVHRIMRENGVDSGCPMVCKMRTMGS
jgi:hypothetical protein